jgi:DNA (cytosine-5)-methyltransferase 1
MTDLTAVDFFCGAGGASVGIRQAGVKLLAAVNHSDLAIKWHEVNHPDTEHFLQDMNQMDFSVLPDFDIAWCSVPCTTHSRARGKGNKLSPQFDASRATAWAVTTMAEFKKPQYIVVENVPEFEKWNLFHPWTIALHDLGYVVHKVILNSKSHHTAQDRERLFLIFCKNHHKDSKGFFDSLTHIESFPQLTAKDIIDLRLGEPKWSKAISPTRANSTIKKIELGRLKYGSEFLIGYYGSNQGRSIHRPIGTIPTKERWAIYNNGFLRMLTIEEIVEFMGFPRDFQIPAKKANAVFLLGNAVVPSIAKLITVKIKQFHENFS